MDNKYTDDDPDATEWDLADTARPVKYIPAPEDDSEWYSEDCPPDCESCSD